MTPLAIEMQQRVAAELPDDAPARTIISFLCEHYPEASFEDLAACHVLTEALDRAFDDFFTARRPWQ